MQASQSSRLYPRKSSFIWIQTSEWSTNKTRTRLSHYFDPELIIKRDQAILARWIDNNIAESLKADDILKTKSYINSLERYL